MINSLQVVAELNASNSVVSQFIYGTKANVPDYMIKTGVNYKFVTDQIGSARLVVNAANSSVVQRIDYDEFGKVLNDTNPSFQPFGFAGGMYDSDTGLVHFGARDYDAETGRWLSKDPISFGGADTNLYGYSVQDPINRIDRDGNDSFLITSIWNEPGHSYLVVDDPDNIGKFRVFDFYPDSTSNLSGLTPFAGTNGGSREQILSLQQVMNLGTIPSSFISQTRTADRATISRARGLIDLADKGELKYNLFNTSKNSLNCISFGRAAQ